MESLINRLKKYNQTIKLDERYLVDINMNSTLFSAKEKAIISSEKIIFQQNIKLKDQGFRFGFKSQQSNLWTITL
jgi:uncharacterized protein YuzE